MGSLRPSICVVSPAVNREKDILQAFVETYGVYWDSTRNSNSILGKLGKKIIWFRYHKGHVDYQHVWFYDSTYRVWIRKHFVYIPDEYGYLRNNNPGSKEFIRKWCIFIISATEHMTSKRAITNINRITMANL